MNELRIQLRPMRPEQRLDLVECRGESGPIRVLYRAIEPDKRVFDFDLSHGLLGLLSYLNQLFK